MATSNDLQEQLQLIQEQQKMRFKEKKVLNSTKEHEIASRVHHDDLELRTVTELKNASEEAKERQLTNSRAHSESSTDVNVTLLQAQIEKLQLESSQLKSHLKQAESKLVQLNHQREEERRAMGSTSSTVTQRIVDLSKRNRDLNSEIATEKNKVRELQALLKKQESEAFKDEKQSEKESAKRETEQESLQSAVDQLKEQLYTANQKRVEYRNECQTLKQELKLAHKVIVKEVGEGVSVTALLKSGSGWRGRAQQIIALQNKVSEMQFKMEENGRARKHSGTSNRVNADHRQVSALKKLEDSKKRSLELAQGELASLQVEYSKLQQQCSALKSRNKILTAELKSLKSQVTGNLQPSIQQPQFISRPPSTENVQDLEKMKVLQQRNQRLQTQLAKCLGELQTLKENGHISGVSRPSHSVLRQPKSAPLPPLGTTPHSRGCTRTIPRKMASIDGLNTGLEEDTLAQVYQLENKRLLELTLSLQQRLDVCSDKLINTETKLCNLTQRYSGKDKTTKTSTPAVVHDIEEKLEMTRNENEVLKETLDTTRQEKLADIRRLHEVMKETKCMFVDSLRQLCVVQTS